MFGLFVSTQRHYEAMRTIDNLRTEIEALKKETREYKTKMASEFELKEKQLTVAYEDKLKKELYRISAQHDKEIMQLKEKFYQEKVEYTEKMRDDNYQKLSKSLTKLHEEGNAQTKFVQELAVTMAGGFKTPNHVRIEHTD